MKNKSTGPTFQVGDIAFCSVKGRLYTPTQVAPIVRAMIRRRLVGCLPSGWRSAVDKSLANEKWLRSRNGQTPGALARDLEMTALLA